MSISVKRDIHRCSNPCFLENGKEKPLIKVGIHEKAGLCHLSQDRFFSTHSRRKIRHVIHGCSEVCFDTPCLSRTVTSNQLSSSTTRVISEFTSLVTGSQSRQKLCFLTTFATGSEKAIRPFQSDFKLFGIPNIPSIQRRILSI
ncbi:hypothetical protein AVEN_72756-1 [Araneus ventricosus]|uniref:Uncharacterized protein n=1 Tax=Araneus ventricosus TaxID=182803 RepID=A0A4Y2DNS3_ARAVE|nr:hypothetical protein AVEN_72756-1 [Araneus ventricosus]